VSPEIITVSSPCTRSDGRLGPAPPARRRHAAGQCHRRTQNRPHRARFDAVEVEDVEIVQLRR
jgi:hypothetical protein